MCGGPESGGEPTSLVECVDCGEVYPAQATDDGAYRPIGVGDGCDCGSDEFARLEE